MCATDDELMDAALGRMTRQYALVDSILRTTRHYLHLHNGGGPDGSAYKRPKYTSQLVDDIRREALSVTPSTRSQLENALSEFDRLHERRTRLSHDVIRWLDGKGFTIAHLDPEMLGYRAAPITVAEVDGVATDLGCLFSDLAEVSNAILTAPGSAFVHD